MALTPAQKATLKAAILANSTWNAFPNNSDGNFDLATLLKQDASPVVKAWRFIDKPTVIKNLTPSEVDNLHTTSKGPALGFLLTHAGGLDCTVADGPKTITDILAQSPAPTSRAAMLLAATENMSLGQQIFGGASLASATPPTAITATVRAFNGVLSAEDVTEARNS